MKKVLSLILATLMIVGCCAAFAGCGKAGNDGFKVGVILICDENEGYTYSHIKGIREAAAALGVTDDQIIWKYTVGEDEKCYDAAVDLVESGCTVIFSNSYGHQSHMQKAAGEYPDVQFVACTGDTASTSGLENFSNAFTFVYESRFVSGVVAGLKIKELVEAGKLTDANYDANGNVKVGYVGAYPYAEVKSGYTAFFLGIKSVYEKVSMEVSFTNSWFDIKAEGTAAEALAARGAVIICQHADSTGAPAAVQALNKNGQVVYSVGYNVDMLSVAPDVALTSATNNWSVYYTYAIGAAMKGEKIATNWAEGYKTGAVAITALGSACAAGTAEKVAEVEAALKADTLHVFDTNTFTVDGKPDTSCIVDLDGNFANTDPADKEAIWDGYFHESELRSAPSFAMDIDGITTLN